MTTHKLQESVSSSLNLARITYIYLGEIFMLFSMINSVELDSGLMQGISISDA